MQDFARLTFHAPLHVALTPVRRSSSYCVHSR